MLLPEFTQAVDSGIDPALYAPLARRNLLVDTLKDAISFALPGGLRQAARQSDAMWRLYAENDDGIAIRTTVGELINQVNIALQPATEGATTLVYVSPPIFTSTAAVGLSATAALPVSQLFEAQLRLAQPLKNEG